MSGRMLNLIADILAIAIVAYGITSRRYYRRDLLLAYCTLNVGFSRSPRYSQTARPVSVSALGLFGILSIIRLRSDAVTQEEIAYYFVALALGLIAGLAANPRWLGPVLSASLVVVMYVVDHPGLTARSQRQNITLDRAYPDRGQLEAALERLLGAEVRHLVVLQLDLVADTTMVDVRFKTPRMGRAALGAVAPAHHKGATA